MKRRERVRTAVDRVAKRIVSRTEGKADISTTSSLYNRHVEPSAKSKLSIYIQPTGPISNQLIDKQLKRRRLKQWT